MIIVVWGLDPVGLGWVWVDEMDPRTTLVCLPGVLEELLRGEGSAANGRQANKPELIADRWRLGGRSGPHDPQEVHRSRPGEWQCRRRGRAVSRGRFQSLGVVAEPSRQVPRRRRDRRVHRTRQGDSSSVFTTASRGVAVGWTEVDMSTPLLPEVVFEIDANPVSFYSGGGG